MLKRIIEWSVANKFILAIFTAFVVVGGILAMRSMPLEALPDLSDVQVIVRTDYAGQAPQIIEDQITYPVASEMLKVPGAETVRGYSFFGTSFVYVIFNDRTDLYWARSRVLEYLSAIRGKLPAGADSQLGPDATGLGWVYQYVLEDETGKRSLADLRAYQDWYLRYQLTAVPGRERGGEHRRVREDVPDHRGPREAPGLRHPRDAGHERREVLQPGRGRHDDGAQ